jgi:hypothetical protein
LLPRVRPKIEGAKLKLELHAFLNLSAHRSLRHAILVP